MNAKTQSLTLPGPAGAIEALLDLPEADLFASPRGTAVIAHPHPQFGGTMTNKVVQTIARACVQCGWRALRFNVRGVGASAGAYDEGRGELDDLLAVVYPEGVWYSYVDAADIDEIVESHLKNGQVVERLRTPPELGR